MMTEDEKKKLMDETKKDLKSLIEDSKKDIESIINGFFMKKGWAHTPDPIRIKDLPLVTTERSIDRDSRVILDQKDGTKGITLKLFKEFLFDEMKSELRDYVMFDMVGSLFPFSHPRLIHTDGEGYAYHDQEFQKCDGRFLNPNVFPELYDVIGSHYGLFKYYDRGSRKELHHFFKLPDMRGFFIRGYDEEVLNDRDKRDAILTPFSHIAGKETRDWTSKHNGGQVLLGSKQECALQEFRVNFDFHGKSAINNITGAAKIIETDFFDEYYFRRDRMTASDKVSGSQKHVILQINPKFRLEPSKSLSYERFKYNFDTLIFETKTSHHETRPKNITFPYYMYAGKIVEQKNNDNTNQEWGFHYGFERNDQGDWESNFFKPISNQRKIYVGRLKPKNPTGNPYS